MAASACTHVTLQTVAAAADTSVAATDTSVAAIAQKCAGSDSDTATTQKCCVVSLSNPDRITVSPSHYVTVSQQTKQELTEGDGGWHPQKFQFGFALLGWCLTALASPSKDRRYQPVLSRCLAFGKN